jgi:hypothetical protein
LFLTDIRHALPLVLPVTLAQPPPVEQRANPQFNFRLPHANWVSPAEAAAWLVLNEHDIPPDLTEAVASVTD